MSKMTAHADHAQHVTHGRIGSAMTYRCGTSAAAEVAQEAAGVILEALGRGRVRCADPVLERREVDRVHHRGPDVAAGLACAAAAMEATLTIRRAPGPGLTAAVSYQLCGGSWPSGISSSWPSGRVRQVAPAASRKNATAPKIAGSAPDGTAMISLSSPPGISGIRRW